MADKKGEETMPSCSNGSNHADKAGLTSSGTNWAGVDPDGSTKTREPSTADIQVAKLGRTVYTSCCPTGTLDFTTKEKEKKIYDDNCNAVAATLNALTTRMSTHPPKFLILCGSLREASYSRKVAVEAGRILAGYGATVKLFDAKDLPLFSADLNPEDFPKVVELRSLACWCEGMIWVSPEIHGNFSAVFKNQIDWIPLKTGSVRPTQGKTLAVMQVEAGSQSFNTVNNLRVLGRWMRMVCIPNQSSIPKAYTEFNKDGTLKDSPYRSRVVDVVDELFKYTLLLRDQQPYLLQRFSERKSAEEKHLKETTKVIDPEVLKSLKDPVFLDVRSTREVEADKGGKTLKGAVRVPLNVDRNPQNLHRTTAEEFRQKLLDLGVSLTKERAFITFCTSGKSAYISRGARAAALLRVMGFEAYNGGCANELRSVLGAEF